MTPKDEFDNVSLQSHSDSVSSEGSYEFAEGNIPDGDVQDLNAHANPSVNTSNGESSLKGGQTWFGISLFQRAKNVATNTTATMPLSEEELLQKEKQNVKWLQESQLTTSDSDGESVASNDSSLVPNIYVEAMHKNETQQAQEGDFDDSFSVDAKLMKMRSELEGHCRKMIRLFEDAPSPADKNVSSNLNQQLREYSRSMAAMFGDDIPSLENIIKARDKENVELRNLMDIERCSAKKDRLELQDQLRQQVDFYQATLQKKEAEARRNHAELVQSLHRALAQQRRAAKAESDLILALHEEHTLELENKDNMIQKLIEDGEEYTALLSQKYEEAIESTTTKYEAAIVQKEREREEHVEAVEKAVEKLHRQYKEYIAHLVKKHDRDTQRTNNESQIIKPQVCEQNLVQATVQIEQLKSEVSSLKKLAGTQYGTTATITKPLAETAAKEAAALLAVHQIASHSNASKQTQTEPERELIEGRRKVAELSRINNTLSHELEIYKTGNKVVDEHKKLKEQPKDSEAENQEDEGKVEDIRNIPFESQLKLQKEVNEREARISELENKLKEAAKENSESRTKTEELKRLCSDQMDEMEVVAEIVDDLIHSLDELDVEIDLLTQDINNYADAVISGDDGDLQSVWDAALDEMDRLLKKPRQITSQAIEKINEIEEANTVEAASDELQDIIADLTAAAEIIETEIQSLLKEFTNLSETFEAIPTSR
jgi:hypothetical protein